MNKDYFYLAGVILTTAILSALVCFAVMPDEEIMPQRLTVVGSMAIDCSQVDQVEVISFPCAGSIDPIYICRVWYEDGRYFDLETESKDLGQALMIHIALNSGI